MTDDEVIVRASVPLTATVDGEVVMFHPERGAYFSLGDVGSRIWELVEEPRSFNAICATLGGEYDVSADDCRRDVDDFLSKLLDAGLVDVRAPEG